MTTYFTSGIKIKLDFLKVFAVLSLVFASCTSTKKQIYFQGQIPALAEAKPFRLTVKPGDILAITVFTINSEAFPYLTSSQEKPVSDTRSAYEKGYLVNEQGEVKLPLIGTVLLKDLTLQEANRLLENKFKTYIDDPIISVKKLNFKITVIGEVAKPGLYPILNEKITLPEILGMAGDLTAFGDRKQIRIIREENNQTKDFLVDITQAASLTPDIYYLHPDDVIYVPPMRRKAFQTLSPSVAILTSLITTTIVALTFIITQTK